MKTSNKKAKEAKKVLVEDRDRASDGGVLEEELEVQRSGFSFARLFNIVGLYRDTRVRIKKYFDDDDAAPEDVKEIGKDYVKRDGGRSRRGFLGSDPLTRLGVFVVVFGVGGFILWSLLASIGSGVIAQGLITVDSLRKSVQHLEGGVVSAIYVKEGDLVQEGDLLIELDQTRSQAEFNLLKTRYYTELGNISRLRSEMEGLAELNLSEELLAVDEDGDIDAETIKDIVDVQAILFASKQDLRLGEKEILESRLVQINRQIAGLQVQLDSKKQEIALLEQELEKMRELSDRNIVDLPRILQRERDLSQARGEVGRITADVALAEVQSGEARLRILQIDRQVRQEAAESILETQEKLFDLNERLVATENVLERTQIRAPQSGHVIQQTVRTVGGVVGPGEPLMEIVPLEDTLIIDARVAGTDIDNVNVGKLAEIKLVAFKQRNIPALYGEVTQISADAVLDSESQLAFYKAKVSIPEDEIEALGLTLVPGMPAEVLIKGRSRSAFSYFVEPLTSFLFRGLNEE